MLHNIYSEFNKMSSDSFLFHIVGESVPACQHKMKTGSRASAHQNRCYLGCSRYRPDGALFRNFELGKYIFTATDLFSKFVFARPIKVLIALHSSVWLSIILCVHSYMHSLLPTFAHPFMDMVNDTIG